jgi:hypothetical protein
MSVPRLAIFLLGALAGAIANRRENVPELKRSVATLTARLDALEGVSQDTRLAAIEARLDEHAARFAEVPSTGQIVSAMEQSLARTMNSIDERLSGQARSIEMLKTTLTETDRLLARVLESVDTLQP